MRAVERTFMMFAMAGIKALMEKSLDNSFSRRKAVVQYVTTKEIFHYAPGGEPGPIGKQCNPGMG